MEPSCLGGRNIHGERVSGALKWNTALAAEFPQNCKEAIPWFNFCCNRVNPLVEIRYCSEGGHWKNLLKTVNPTWPQQKPVQDAGSSYGRVQVHLWRTSNVIVGFFKKIIKYKRKKRKSQSLHENESNSFIGVSAICHVNRKDTDICKELLVHMGTHFRLSTLHPKHCTVFLRILVC